MADDFKTPGVYIWEISKFPPSVAQVETAIPAFIGYTEFATEITLGDLHLKPKRIKSLAEYEVFFGEAISETFEVTVGEDDSVSLTTTPTAPTFYMHYALQLYFANGGGPCYIVSAGQEGDQVNYEQVSPKKGLKPALDALAKEDEPTLIVFPDAVKLGNYAIYQDALNQCGELQDRFVIIDIVAGTDPDIDNNVINGATGFRTVIGSGNLCYGSAYYPHLRTLLNYKYDELHTAVKIGGIDHAMDSLKGGENDKYYHLAKAAIEKATVILPPSSLIAGVYATVDRTRGVWKSPGNVSLRGVKEPAVFIDKDTNDRMNVDPTGKSVNAIRSFSGKGVMVWGARTLAGNDNEWRYISVRRFFNMVEESVKKATEKFVFEPNDANTWTKVRAMIENYLTTLWREGALAGAKPEHAFYVRVGLGQTMTAQDILEGKMYVEIGMAVVRPAEFIILKFSHKMQTS